MMTNEQIKAENETIRALLASGVEEQLLAFPGVVHVSVGLKETAGKITDRLCIRVYVETKKSKDQLPAAALVPAEIDGVPTDVNTIGQFEFSLDNSKYRPVKAGIQITNRIIGVNSTGTGTQMSRGTLGFIAIDKTDNAPVLVSNWHVLFANTGTAGDKVFQPAPTSLPQLTLLQLPFRPPDDSNKIAVIRRSTINARVDGAIAAIDVSSWCNCCGIRYSNEISGLSVANRPARNTIVGDEPALGGMTVFKVGQATGRTEGRVVDPNYPSFDITKDGTTYTFTGQVAIQSVDHSRPFALNGDSGSAIVNSDNKIVGLLFASGRNMPVSGVDQPFVSLANHIGDVLSALNIRIRYSPNVVVNAGALLTDVPPTVLEAPIPEPYRALRARLESNENTARLFALARRHNEEITYLVNHCRPVTLAWHRCQGPALLAIVMSAVRDGHYRLPASVSGVAPGEALEKMRTVLSLHASPGLKTALEGAEAATLREALKDCRDLNDALERITSNKVSGSLPQEVSI